MKIEDKNYILDSMLNVAYEIGNSYEFGNPRDERTKELQSILETCYNKIKEIQIDKPLITTLYAIKDIDNDCIIFNARGGAYKDVDKVQKKLGKLKKENANGNYKIVEYKLEEN